MLDLEGSRESKGFGGRIVGRSTSARAVRVGLVAAAIFSVVAARGVAWNAPSWGAFVMPDFVFGAAAPGGAPAPFPAEPPAPAPAPAVVAAPAVLTFEALSIDSTPAALPQSTAPAAPSAAPVTAPGVVPSFGPLPAAPPRTEMARL